MNQLARPFFRILPVLLLALPGHTVSASDAIASRDVEDLMPPALQQAQTAVLGTPPPAAPSSTVRDTVLTQMGPVALRSHFTYRYLYGDGVPASPGRQLTTSIHDFAPEFLFDIGSHWMLDYTPTWRFYSDDAFHDKTDHSVRLTGGTAYENWLLQFSERYAVSSPTLVETAAQTDQRTWATAFNASGRFGSKWRLDTAINYNERYSDVSPDSRDLSGSGWVNYQLSGGVNAALGLTGGTVNMSVGPDMTYVRPLARLNWQLTNKTSFDLQGGVEKRSFSSSGRSDTNNAILNAALHYAPVETTRITLQADRDVSVSYFASQITKNTRLSAALDQRLLEKFQVRVRVGREKSSYMATTATAFAGRDDTHTTFDARLSSKLLLRGTLAFVYRHGKNDSSLAGYTFTSDQYGVELGFRF